MRKVNEIKAEIERVEAWCDRVNPWINHPEVKRLQALRRELKSAQEVTGNG